MNCVLLRDENIRKDDIKRLMEADYNEEDIMIIYSGLNS